MSFPMLIAIVTISFVALILTAHRLMGDPVERTERRRRDVLAQLSALPSKVVRIRLEELEYFDFTPGLNADPPDGTPMRDTPAADALFDALESGLIKSSEFRDAAFGDALRKHFVALAQAEEDLGYSADPRWGPWYAESGAWEPIVLHAWAYATALERECTP